MTKTLQKVNQWKSRKLCPRWRDKIKPQITTKWSRDRQPSKKRTQNDDSGDDSGSWKRNRGKDWEDARNVYQRPRRNKPVQAGFRKGRGTRDQIANICWIIKKAREFHKTSISALLTLPKPSTVWITINCGKFWRWEYQTIWPASWETCMQVRKQQLELDMEQQTGSK